MHNCINKILSIVLVALMLSITGCQATKPKKTVQTFDNQLIKFYVPINHRNDQDKLVRTLGCDYGEDRILCYGQNNGFDIFRIKWEFLPTGEEFERVLDLKRLADDLNIKEQLTFNIENAWSTLMVHLSDHTISAEYTALDSKSKSPAYRQTFVLYNERYR